LPRPEGEIVLEYMVIGSGFAFAAALQPGPLQAYLLSSVVRRGWRATLPASFAPLLSDGPIVVIALILLSRVPESFQIVIRAAGGLLLLYLAWASYRNWQESVFQDSEQSESAPRTLLQAVMVNLLNPNPYLGWSLVLGPAVMDAWQKDRTYAVVLIAAFYGTMVVGLAGTIFLFGSANRLGPRGRRGVVLLSAGILAALGICQLVLSFLDIFGAI
jgi:threonine/homoserine/homoserine lactone efflux protein